MKYSRFFLNRLLQTLRDNSKNKIIKLDEHFHTDLQWFKNFLDVFNGKSFYVKSSVDAEIHLDACLSGVGAVFKNQIYAGKIPERLQKFNIAALEMLNILVAVRLWAKDWSGLSLKIHCDNQAVVSVLRSGKTKDPDLAGISRNIFMLCAQYDIFLVIQHVPGKNNQLADLLSRWSDSVSDKAQLNSLLPSHTWLQITDEHFWVDPTI